MREKNPFNMGKTGGENVRTIKILGTPNEMNKALNRYRQKMNDNFIKECLKQRKPNTPEELSQQIEQTIENEISEMILEQHSKE